MTLALNMPALWALVLVVLLAAAKVVLRVARVLLGKAGR